MNRHGTVALAALLILCGCDDSCVTGPLSADGTTALQRAVVKMEAPWTQHAKTCQVGGYTAMAPADGTPGEIFVTRNGITVSDGRLDSKIGEHAGFVNLNGQWSRLEKRGEQLGALVNGEWRLLEKDGRFLYRLKSP